METVTGTSVAAVGGVLGIVVTIEAWLLRKLLAAKDQQIRDTKERLEHVEHDRDYWRDMAVRLLADHTSPSGTQRT